MKIPPKAYPDPQQIHLVSELVQRLREQLDYMQTVADSMTEQDCTDPECLKWFSDQVIWSKCLFERMEVLVRAKGQS